LTYNAADRSGIIKASTLVITGTEDREIRPISSKVITSLAPKAKQVKMIGRGHNSNIEMRGECNTEALDFLRS
jgi:pimeloyl-ACP methyl ester carboxylesterase